MRGRGRNTATLPSSHTRGTPAALALAGAAISAGWARKGPRARPMVQRQLAEMVHGVAFWCTPLLGAHAATDAGRASPMGRNIAEMVRGGALWCAPPAGAIAAGGKRRGLASKCGAALRDGALRCRR